MMALTPGQSRGTQISWIVLAAAFLIAVPTVRAQQPTTATRPTAMRPMYRTYQRPVAAQPVIRPMVSRPIQVRPIIYQQAIPVRRSSMRPVPPTSTVRAYIAPELIAPRSYLFANAQSSLLPPDFDVAAFQPTSEWKGAGSQGHFNWLVSDGAFVNNFGFWQPPANLQMLPLGFGLWPACDSAENPGRYWTIGPCFGLGDYQSVSPAYQNEYLARNTPSQYYQVFEIIEQPTAPPSGARQPSAPEKEMNMVICLTDGRQWEVSDWWVTEGRFFFIPIKGNTESVDLNVLDLKKTIETNETRGRTFMLNFTPPNERPVLPALPSNQ